MKAAGVPLARARFASGIGSSSSLSVPVRSIGSAPEFPSWGIEAGFSIVNDIVA